MWLALLALAQETPLEPPGYEVDAAGQRALRFRVRASRPVVLRWTALDDGGRALFQRRVDFGGGAVWTEIEEPLALWRWGDGVAGDWARVRRFSVSADGEFEIDGVRLIAGEHEAWVRDVAFDGGRFVEAGGLTIGTDAEDLDLDRLAARLRPIDAWLSRVFEAPPRPAMLLVFRDREAYVEFFKRLGAAWRVSIAPPSAGGYTVQNIAASFFDPNQGADRPVFLHEAVHAAVAARLGLVCGADGHDPWQEALANYVQLAVHPDSLERGAYRTLFSGDLVPLAGLFAGRATTAQYARLASVVGFLAEEDPARLRAAVTAEGVDLEALERDWWAWGCRVFVDEGRADPHFARPAEWDR